MSLHCPSSQAALGTVATDRTATLRIASVLRGCFGYPSHSDELEGLSREDSEEKGSQSLCGNKSSYLLHDCEIMLKIDSSEGKRKFVPPVVRAICTADTRFYFDRFAGQS